MIGNAMKLLKQFAGLAALALITLVIWPIAVFAQDPSGGTVTEPTFVQQLVAATLPALGLAITALLTWAASEFKKRTGIDIEARHREALQSALMNGILYAMQKAGWVPGQPTTHLLGDARTYVERSVPEALRQFGIDTVTTTGRAALDRLLTPHLPLPLGTILPNGDKLVGRAQ